MIEMSPKNAPISVRIAAHCGSSQHLHSLKKLQISSGHFEKELDINFDATTNHPANNILHACDIDDLRQNSKHVQEANVPSQIVVLSISQNPIRPSVTILNAKNK